MPLKFEIFENRILIFIIAKRVYYYLNSNSFNLIVIYKLLLTNELKNSTVNFSNYLINDLSIKEIIFNIQILLEITLENLNINVIERGKK